ncbi:MULTISPECIES: PAS domain-containing hybrid sensor histidine kinase/response regulator [Sphingomonas]|uniref:histidine kinase n=1 Tax=Sphingomonas zeae TaxID=1646122 RepID=A0A7Y6B6Z8_9SPHN|nr:MULTISPECIES: PAS domain-containing hybrid sensor histidine kinase/response regulator [Sphingomonas]MBB4047438.1 signal transduction histidine kinase/ActR/RegA family two-component response regulator [Sphingomonas zeae]MDK8185202.1 PAS domain-containing protein [Sphingomonas zeae]MDK8214855.1 PAS domain-containing protein [Sphingomonas sp. UMB7805-LC452B]NUU48582.1 PAS domain-containing protein [Sphingomonas zeae]
MVHSSAFAFLNGVTGQVVDEIVAFDWTQTSLGGPETWPTALRCQLATMIACPVPMYLVWGPDLISFYNDAYRPILGYRAATAMGMPFPILWSSIWDDIAPLVDKALSGKVAQMTDMRLDLAREGRPEESFWTFSYSPVFDDRGAIAGMVCVTGETTARVLAERRQREADERLNLALNSGAHVGMWDWDVVNDSVRSDRRFAAMYGVDPVAAETGMPIAQFFQGIHPEDRERVEREVAEAMAGAGAGEGDAVGRFVSEYRLVQSDGAIHWVSARGRCITDESGRCVRFPGVSFDITDRVCIEQKLRATEARARLNAERVQLALEAGAIIGTWFWDLPSDRFTVDEPFARNFGLDPALGHEGLSLAQVVETVHPDDRAGLAEAIDEAIARGGAYAHQYRVKRHDGRYHWLEANGRVDHAPDGTPLHFPGVLIDVGVRRALEAERDTAIAELRALTDQLEQRVADRTAELMRAEEALRQSQKMEAVGQLTGGLAHDFNNLLAGISGSLELMALRLAQGRVNDLDRYMDAAQGATRRAAALTHRLLAFSRRQTLAPRPTDIGALVAGMSDLIRRTVGPGIALETQGADDLWTVLVDAPQLENALLNLCINARDAMPDGGRITIEMVNRHLDKGNARFADIPDGEYLALCVTDTGTGMTPDVMEKAFDPFFTTKPLGQGTGLGLSMIYGFAQQSGGQVRIRSAPGEGTTVFLYLPRHDGPAESEGKDATGVTASTSGAGETVLVVDDEATVRMMITDVLRDMGYRVIEAADSVEGLAVLRSDERIDLLVTDVGLPGGMNGRQLADAARELRHELNVMFVTGYAENAVLNSGHLSPGMQLLTKPFTVDALVMGVQAAMGAGARRYEPHAP